MQRTTINGLPAVYGAARVNTGQQQVGPGHQGGGRKALAAERTGRVANFVACHHTFEAVVAAALEELGLDAGILDAAKTDVLDEKMRDSHQEGIDHVGDEVGTPVVAFNGTAFFGPVMTRIPRGEEAGRIFDGAVALAEFPYFYEIKRSRTTKPQFD